MDWQQWQDLCDDDLRLEDEDFDAWLGSGLRAIDVYLARHAAFDAWCREQRQRYGRDPGSAPPRPG
jgi:hypothetical protein